ncbi:MAG: D-alanyl-D-alanine carboxypeptidase [Holosporaceae bacterium]|nr:D-alanyl-D-alanine carboxypeptidase [Holosporaceae bacterium]
MECFAFSPVTGVIVIDAKSGDTIYAHNADQKTQPASLTKMMTLSLIFRALRSGKISQNTKILISQHAAAQCPSKLGLKSGDQIRVKDAILSLIVKSANDIAVALAEHVGKTEAAFVAMMNQEAKRLGMTSTVFFNSSGWPDARQMTTARDMAILARSLQRDYSVYYHLFATKRFYWRHRCILGHHALLGSHENMVIDGIKTGYVYASGFHLVASAVKGKNRVISIVLGGRTSKDRDSLSMLLLKKSFPRLLRKQLLAKENRFKYQQVSPKGQTEQPRGISNKIKIQEQIKSEVSTK